MGLTLEFLLGDRDAIVSSFAEDDWDRLEADDVVYGRADLSLHIDPLDLDRLSRCMAGHSGKPSSDLSPHLEFAVDTEEGGAMLVSIEWVAYVAAVPEDRLSQLVSDWMAEMRREYNNPQIVVTDDAVKAVRDLWGLCRRALSTGGTLVHIWCP